MTGPLPKLEIHYADDWAALYVNGVLDETTIGDSYHARDRVFGIVGVVEVHDNAWMRGQNQREGVATTLEEVAAYRTERDARLQRAAELRAEAARLIEQAGEMEQR